MKYVILGKILKKIWYVDDKKVSIKNGDTIKKQFTAKPELKATVEAVEYPEILRFEGELKYNSNNTSVYRKINISETEEVFILKETFRADLNEMHIYVDKVLEEIEEKKESAEIEYSKIMKEFNKTMIKSNPKLDQYCELHHLNYGLTDCFKLFDFLYPNNTWSIIDGKLVVSDINDYTLINIANTTHNCIATSSILSSIR